MQKYHYIFWELVFVFCFSCSIKPAFPPFNQSDYFDVADSARLSRKYIVVLLTSSECGICHAMLEEWQQSKSVQVFMRDYLWYQSDISKPENLFFPQLLNTIATPTLLIISPDQEVRYAHNGFLKSSDLEGILQRICQGEQISPEWNGTFYTASGYRFYQLLTDLLQAELILHQNNQDSLCWNQALSKVKHSIDIESYFMNRYLAWQLYSYQGNIQDAVKMKVKIMENLSAFDRLIYSDLLIPFFPEKQGTQTIQSSVFQREYDFGIVSASDPEFVITYRNEFSSPLIVKMIESGCFCLQVTWDQTPLLKGQEGKIRIQYKRTKKEKVIKKIYVYTNLSERPYELEVRCELV